MTKLIKSLLVKIYINYILIILVLDLHPEWSGPCELMNPTFKSLATNVDDFEKRIDLISVIFK